MGDQIGPITLYDVDGTPVELASLSDRPVLLPLVRYYGCMPCRAFLSELNEIRDELHDAGVRLVGVGGAADYQARHLMEHGIGFPLLLDPRHDLYRALDVRRIRWWMLLQPVTWRNYLLAARRARQGRITGHPLQAPGLAIVDTDGTIRFLHRGKTLGDYPTIEAIRSAVGRISATS
ncbi:peroxiredoxin-like family protein [Pseudonocardia dioxanivorans]|uniref:peroxiredoxin-like family protein n=1 Tax=Pseudonocardia dioxanivorans TaxID=240495 RepID=UPI00030F557A|nr:peroxiredoxin-like family protein [Pseudonocardia dioxanivorans]